MEEVLNLINIYPTNPFQILNQHEFFRRSCVCPSNNTFDRNKKISMLVMGPHSKEGKSTKDKANISYPKVNRGCPPLTANRISADCVQISLGPQYNIFHWGSTVLGFSWIDNCQEYCTGSHNSEISFNLEKCRSINQTPIFLLCPIKFLQEYCLRIYYPAFVDQLDEFQCHTPCRSGSPRQGCDFRFPLAPWTLLAGDSHIYVFKSYVSF